MAGLRRVARMLKIEYYIIHRTEPCHVSHVRIYRGRAQLESLAADFYLRSTVAAALCGTRGKRD